MIPKDKAVELYDNFFLLHNSATDENGNFFMVALNKGLAKQCSLIAVDEILIAIPNACDYDSRYNHEMVYWQLVKEQIEKL